VLDHERGIDPCPLGDLSNGGGLDPVFAELVLGGFEDALGRRRTFGISGGGWFVHDLTLALLSEWCYGSLNST
jgi:hypothetical protein